MNNLENPTTFIQEKALREEQLWKNQTIDNPEKALAEGILVSIPDNGEHYRLIGPLRRGVEPRLVRSEAQEMLQEIQDHWQVIASGRGLDATNVRLSISSLYRDDALQQELRRSTDRVVRGISAHQAGAAIDFDPRGYFLGSEFKPVNYQSENYIPGYTQALREVLEQMEQQQKCDFIDEGVCYHVCALPKIQ